MDWNTVFAVISAVTGLFAAGAACWSAASARDANKQAARDRRTVLEREASRGISTVFPTVARIVRLSERLEYDYTTLFALAVRNVSAAAPHKEQAAATIRHEAEWIASRVRVWLKGTVEEASTAELEALVRATDTFIVQLEKMEESLESDLGSVEEQIRPLAGTGAFGARAQLVAVGTDENGATRAPSRARQ